MTVIAYDLAGAPRTTPSFASTILRENSGTSLLLEWDCRERCSDGLWVGLQQVLAAQSVFGF